MKEKTIMIVDDSAFMRNHIQSMLKRHGYHELMEAKDGKTCVALYQQHHPDVVLLDITMPDKSGIEVLEELLLLDHSAKVVICSALGQDQMIAKALRIGAKDFLVKPFKEEQLVELLKALTAYDEA